MIKLITATLQTGTLSQPSSHQGECPQTLVKWGAIYRSAR
jgi:hypothetical protein